MRSGFQPLYPSTPKTQPALLPTPRQLVSLGTEGTWGGDGGDMSTGSAGWPGNPRQGGCELAVSLGRSLGEEGGEARGVDGGERRGAAEGGCGGR